MILPILAYGDPILKTRATKVEATHEGLTDLIQNMWETMYRAEGVGLAAPQIGKSLRIFIVDASPFEDDDPSLAGFKKLFINPEILEEWGEEWMFSEGCLSFPDLREDISRKPNLRIRYYDELFQIHEGEYSGIVARIIQHEYDHIEGIVMVDHMSPLKRTLMRSKLLNISKGAVSAGYPMRFPLKKR